MNGNCFRQVANPPSLCSVCCSFVLFCLFFLLLLFFHGKEVLNIKRNDEEDFSVVRLVWMRPCHFFPRLVGVRGNSRVVSKS